MVFDMTKLFNMKDLPEKPIATFKEIDEILNCKPIKEVWLVGHWGPEHDVVKYCCVNKEVALKHFHIVREELLKDAKDMLEYDKQEGYDVEMFSKMIEKLGEQDPDKIDNYPHETPYIKKMELIR
jgi:hypothetical protein